MAASGIILESSMIVTIVTIAPHQHIQDASLIHDASMVENMHKIFIIIHCICKKQTEIIQSF